jgi:acyl-CoA dehydrogenase
MKQKSIIEWLLSQTGQRVDDPYPEFNLWKPVYHKTITPWTDPIDRAIAGGFVADRLAYAFTAGYQASLQCLLPSLPVDTIAALCISEEGGGHPRQIKTTLRRTDQKESISPLWEINGRKKFITNASEASRLLIAASAGEMPDGKNQIQMIEIERDAPGITVIPMKELPFVPEISHGILLLEGVHAKEENLLPGDGYLKYIKPFRTIEDIHVSAAIIGYLFRIAGQYGWPRDIQERCMAIFSGFRFLSAEDPGNPAVHIALAGILNQLARLVDDIEPHWANVEVLTRTAWVRDRKLLDIAREARSLRPKAAWSYFTRTG